MTRREYVTLTIGDQVIELDVEQVEKLRKQLNDWSEKKRQYETGEVPRPELIVYY